MTAPTLPRSAAPNNWLSTWTAGATLTGDPTKNNQLAANASQVTLVGGPGDDTFIVYDPSDTVIEQPNAGIDTVETWGSGYTLPANVENLQLMGSANASATGNSGSNLIIGNAGNDRITTGGGNDVLIAGTGSDYFVPSRDLGTTTWITGFKTAGAAQDKLDLYGYGFQGFAEVRAATTQVGSDVRIDLGGGQSLMLAGKNVSDITPAAVDVENSKAGLHLTFDDEFNSLSLNTGTAATAHNVWKTTFNGGTRTLVGNNEQEIYVDPDYWGSYGVGPLGLNPFSVQNGVLTIAARPAPPQDVPYLGGYKYTSGVLTTQSSFAQTYGYFEVRAQVPSGQGLWPAFWLLPADNTWPPELDVMEQIGSNNSYVSNGVLTTVNNDHYVQGTYVNANTSQGFHTYGVDWTAQNITFYFDGQQTYQIDTPADMNKPMYMLLDLAVGGSFPGSPNASTNWSAANFNIDYVRAYSHDPNATAAPMVTFSNSMTATDLSSSFSAPMTGPGTSTSYGGQQMGIQGVAAGSVMTVAYDSNNALTVTDDSAWNTMKDVTIKSAVNGSVTVHNIVDTEITLGNGDSEVAVTDAKRGTIRVGNGNDTISVAAKSDNNALNVMSIVAGDGDNHISFTGASNAGVSVAAGAGSNKVSISGQAFATVKTGAGNDDLVDNSSGSVGFTGGAGSDVFEFLAGAHATVTDYQSGQDSIVLHGVTASQVHVSAGASSTLIDLGGGSTVQLAGVSLQQSAIKLAYA